MPALVRLPGPRTDEVRVSISGDALRTISLEVAAGGVELETGGILLGLRSAGRIHITVAGEPGPAAQRAPTRFLRDRVHADRLAENAWIDHRADWIGEWHTHPNVSPEPSVIDYESYVRHLADPDLNFDKFVAIIVAVTSALPPVIVCWVIGPSSVTPVELEIEQEVT